MLTKLINALKKLDAWCVENCFLATAILGVCMFLTMYCTLDHWEKNQKNVAVIKGVSPEVVNRVMNGETSKVYEDIQRILKLQEAEKTEKELKSHKQPSAKELDNKYERTYLTPEESTKENIKADLDKRDGDAIIVDKESNVNPGTTIYSIKNVKTTVGLGVYAGYSEGVGKSYGLHYRNRRTVYQVGVDNDGHLEGRVAYEVFQW